MSINAFSIFFLVSRNSVVNQVVIITWTLNKTFRLFVNNFFSLKICVCFLFVLILYLVNVNVIELVQNMRSEVLKKYDILQCIFWAIKTQFFQCYNIQFANAMDSTYVSGNFLENFLYLIILNLYVMWIDLFSRDSSL